MEGEFLESVGRGERPEGDGPRGDALRDVERERAAGVTPGGEAPGGPGGESGEGPVAEAGEEVSSERSSEGEGEAPDESPERSERGVDLPRLRSPRRGRRLVKKEEVTRPPLTATERLLLLDTWKRSGLPARDFSVLVGISRHTLYSWKKRFSEQGPAGLEDRPRGGPRGSRLPEVTRRAILLMKEDHPDWGTQRISDMLYRGPALAASPSAVARVLKEAGYELEEVPSRRHREGPRRFERARPNQLWQTDLFTFVMKRQNRRVYLVAFLDDHSRFVTGWGLHSTQSALLVLEVLRSAVTSYNRPEEILSDNGSQYVTWRGRSAFSRELERRGIRHVVSSPRRPQTLGKIERFWGSVWREFLELALFQDMEDARRRIALYIDHYNFRRPHQGIDGLTPADRFFEAAPKVRDMLRARVEENALDRARQGTPRRPFYLTGEVGGRSFSVHAEGERVILQREGEEREEVELTAPKGETSPPVTPEGHPEDHPGEDEVGAPGTSPLDDLLEGRGEERREEPEGGEEGGGS